MPWYVAHVIEAFLPRAGYNEDEDIVVYENALLLWAADADEANRKAETMGRESVVDDDTFTVNDKPAKPTFIGIRKLISVVNSPLEEGPWDPDRLAAGAEVTYSEFVVKASDLAALAAGETVQVIYEDSFTP